MKPMFRKARASLFLLALGAMFVGACESSPTGEATKSLKPAFSGDPHITLYGPDSITVAGNYNYYGYIGYPYPDFWWAVRDCQNSLTVAGCSVSWINTTGTPYNGGYNELISQHLSPEPSGCMSSKFTKNHTFQVRMIATAFGHGADTSFKVTRLCTAELP